MHFRLVLETDLPGEPKNSCSTGCGSVLTPPWNSWTRRQNGSTQMQFFLSHASQKWRILSFWCKQCWHYDILPSEPQRGRCGSETCYILDIFRNLAYALTDVQISFWQRLMGRKLIWELLRLTCSLNQYPELCIQHLLLVLLLCHCSFLCSECIQGGKFLHPFA